MTAEIFISDHTGLCFPNDSYFTKDRVTYMFFNLEL